MSCSLKSRSISAILFVIISLCFPVFNAASDDLNIVIYNNGSSEQIRSKPKYILLWDGAYSEPLTFFLERQAAFYTFNCPQKNCFVTADKNHFYGDLSNFDAIMFNGALMGNISTYPKERYEHQKYIFVDLEPAIRHVLCHSFFDGFFNWTATYKLDSDIVMKYFTILDINTNEPVGPKKDMQWISNMNDVSEEFANRLKTKTKAAAWLVTNCWPTARNQLVKYLNHALEKYDLRIDVFGCGWMNLKCERKYHQNCAAMIKKDYFFYMALENSFLEDYVTEKVLHGLLNNAVPIVYGGADYSRFLPPGSYINAQNHTVESLAALINFYIDNPSYFNFFKWRNHYKYVSTWPEYQANLPRLFEESIYEGEGVCKLCELLNNFKLSETTSVHTKMRSWWYKDYEAYCKPRINKALLENLTSDKNLTKI